MIGAILGDIVESTRKNKPIKTSDFIWTPKSSTFTDASLMNFATGLALLNDKDFARSYKKMGLEYANPKGSYSPKFKEWLLSDSIEPNQESGNGALMRLSVIGWLNTDLDKKTDLAERATLCTHTHPEATRASRAFVELIHAGINGEDKEHAVLRIVEKYQFEMGFTLADYRSESFVDLSATKTLQIVLRCFYEATSIESSIRNAISMGALNTSMASLTGAIAEAFFPADYRFFCQAISFLPDNLSDLLFDMMFSREFSFSKKYDDQLIKTIKSYKSARYEIEWNDGVETIQLNTKVRMNKTSIGIITASNPQSMVLDDEKNELLNNRLLKMLIDEGFSVFPAINVDAKGFWPDEKGFAVLGLTKSQLMEYAVKFNQNAVVFIENGLPPELVWCA